MTGIPDEPRHRPDAPPLPLPVEDVRRPRTSIRGPPAEDTPVWRADPAPLAHRTDLPASTTQALTSIISLFSETTRNGRWEVPAVLQVNQAFSEVLLDLREAVITSPVVELRVTGAFMACKVIVPPGVPVEWAGGVSLFSDSKADPSGTEVDRAGGCASCTTEASARSGCAPCPWGRPSPSGGTSCTDRR